MELIRTSADSSALNLIKTNLSDIYTEVEQQIERQPGVFDICCSKLPIPTSNRKSKPNFSSQPRRTRDCASEGLKLHLLPAKTEVRKNISHSPTSNPPAGSGTEKWHMRGGEAKEQTSVETVMDSLTGLQVTRGQKSAAARENNDTSAAPVGHPLPKSTDIGATLGETPTHTHRLVLCQSSVILHPASFLLTLPFLSPSPPLWVKDSLCPAG